MRMLRNEDVERIIAGAYDLLATTGVKVIHEEALQILSDHGAAVDFSDQSATMPQDLVEKCLKTVPSSLDFYNFEGDKTVRVEGDTVNFVLDSAPVFLLDSATKKIRGAKTRDMIEIIKLVDNLEHVPFMTASVVPEDVPISLCDVIRFHQALIYSGKPVFGGAFSIDGLLVEIELLSALAGGKDEMGKKPRVMMAANPSAPLMWTQTSAGNLVDCAKHNIPVMIIPIPLSGGTTPVTPRRHHGRTHRRMPERDCPQPVYPDRRSHHLWWRCYGSGYGGRNQRGRRNRNQNDGCRQQCPDRTIFQPPDSRQLRKE